jgi:hypothetical protein
MQGDMPERITMFQSYYEAAEELSVEGQKDFFHAIMTYAFTGEEPELKGVARGMFKLVKPNLDASRGRAQSAKKDKKGFDSDLISPEDEVYGNQNEAGTDDQRIIKTESTENQNEIKTESTENQNEINSESNPNQTPSLGEGVRRRSKESGYGSTESDTEREHEGEPAPATQTLDRPQSPRAVKPRVVDTGFEQFWAAYPKRQAKADAEKAWAKLFPRADPARLEKILDTVQRYMQSGQWRETRYIPNPATFLNREKWDEEIIVVTTNNSGRGLSQPATGNRYFELAAEMEAEERRVGNDHGWSAESAGRY